MGRKGKKKLHAFRDYLFLLLIVSLFLIPVRNSANEG